MKKFVSLIGILGGLVLLQESFLPPLFAGGHVPNIAFLAMATSVIVFGFSAVLPWLVMVGLGMDIMSYGRIGMHVVLLVSAAYLISLFSKKFSIGYRGLGNVTLAGMAIGGALLNHYFVSDLLNGQPLATFRSSESWMTSSAFLELVAQVGLFFLFYFGFRRLRRLYTAPEYSVATP
ncbi:hypothetical protein EPO05_04290 [Patescibacteria group bacterium]|nr:MAG: hypothetical protein EPO05_04290 [Patescibacteria group bacterium]